MSTENSRTAPISAEVMATLRALRKSRGMSTQKLADAVTEMGFPVRRTSLANWETGRINTVPVDFLILAAQALGTDAPTILGRPACCPTCHGRPPEGFTCNTCGGGQ